MPYHFRFTPHDLDFDLRAFVESADKYIVGFENKDKQNKQCEPHYHIYMETKYTRDTVVNWAYKHLGIKKGQKGTANKYFAVKNWDDDISYFCKGSNVQLFKGFDMETIDACALLGYQKYIQPYLNDMITVIKGTEPDSGTPASEASPTAPRKDEWTLLFMAQPEMDISANWEPIDWRKWICKYYLARTRPVPRTGDLYRYAISLHILRKSKGGQLENILDIETDKYVESLEIKPNT